MPVSLWLRPSVDIAARLDADIETYARATQRTLFPAHVTLASGIDADEAEISLMCADFSALDLRLLGVLRAGTFFQAFALRFDEDPTLTALKTHARRSLKTDQVSEYPPHLSLTYGADFDDKAMMVIADKFSGHMRFDRLVLVRYDVLDATQGAVAAWRYGGEMPLLG